MPPMACVEDAVGLNDPTVVRRPTHRRAQEGQPKLLHSTATHELTLSTFLNFSLSFFGLQSSLMKTVVDLEGLLRRSRVPLD